MNPERSRKIGDLLEAADALGAENRAAYLEKACADDPALRAELEARLRVGARAFTPGPSADPNHFGHYVILRELGRGGQGTVYLAEDPRLSRKVALKVLTALAAQSPATRTRLEREAEAASKLDHPGICTVYEVGEIEAIPYIAMRYVEGEPLSSMIAGARSAAQQGDDNTYLDFEAEDFDPSAEVEDEAGSPSASDSTSTAPSTRNELMQAVHVIEKVARALHVAHEAGLIHRDIKPANIIVKGKDPVIVDFGLARDEESNVQTLTEPGQLLGTPAYMSAEQISGQNRLVDRRTDVYSLGVTLFECLTLKRPFEAPTREQLYLNILTTDPPDPRRLNRAIPTDLGSVLEVALEKDIDRRYQTAADLAEDLRRVRAHEPILARPPGPIARTVRWARRRPALAALAVAVVLLVAIGTTLAANLGDILKERRDRLAERVEAKLEDGFLGLTVFKEVEPSVVRRFEEALELEPEAVLAVAGLAAATPGPRAAIAILDRHRELATRHPELDRMRVAALTRSGDRDNARRLADRLGPPTNALDYYLTALAKSIDAAEPDARREVLDLYRNAQLRSPPRALYYVSTARAAAAAGHRDEAIRTAEAVTDLWNDSFHAWFARGMVHRDLGDPTAAAAAAAAFQRAAEIRPNDARAHRNWGEALLKSGDQEDAITRLREALRIDPGDRRTRVGLADALRATGDVDGVIELLRDALANDAGDNEARARLGNCLLATGRVPEALDAFEAVADREPQRAGEHAQQFYRIGEALQTKGDRAGALRAFETAVRIDPVARDRTSEDTARYRQRLFALGAALYGEFDYAGAARAFETATKISPDSFEGHFTLGEIRIALGDFERASRSMKLARKLAIEQGRWPATFDAKVKECDRLAHLSAELDAVDRGDFEPASAIDTARLGRIACSRKRYALAVRLYERAFRTERELLRNGERPFALSAAVAAAMAAPGAADERARAALRNLALTWLGDDLASARSRFAASPSDLARHLHHRKNHPSLASVREPNAIHALPPDERAACRSFWNTVDQLLGATEEK